ncbi:metallophosphoesterase [Persicitalea sp.]|uniref:metallophosphoesterase n=1 Tax=Persicitalea sp. TaxID=3100273 RepID=UPI0035946486
MIGNNWQNEPVSPQHGNFIKLKEESTRTLDHSITIDNLQPDREYKYTIGLGNDPSNSSSPLTILEASEDHVFRTPPLPGGKSVQGENRKTKMWVLGDFGAYKSDTSNTLQDKVIASMQQFMTTNSTGPMDLWLWLGDNAYEQGTKEQYQDHIFHKGKARYDWMFRRTPFFATPGNHDYYDGAVDVPDRDTRTRVQRDVHYYSVVDNFTNAEAGGEPSGTEAYYSFNYSNIHFISLDTYGFEKLGDKPKDILAPNSNQYKWLERDLKKAKEDSRINWVIVFMHHPPYTGGTHSSDQSEDNIYIKGNLIPLLDQYKVDLVLAGHSHDYQRTRLMRGHTGNSSTFNSTLHTPSTGSNARSSGSYDSTPNSCFYYKTSAASTNEGIVYAVTGLGGKPIEFEFDPNITDKLMVSKSKVGGSMYLEVENKKLVAKYISVDNQILDQFTIFKDFDGFTIPELNGNARTATCECTEALTDKNSFTHYVDDKGNLLLSINKFGIDIGKAGVAPFEVKLGGAPGHTNVGAFYPQNYVQSDRTRSFSSGWRVMNRYWFVKPATELADNQQVVVRHYYTYSDLFNLNYKTFNDLYTTNPDERIIPQGLKFYKVNSQSSSSNIDPVSGNHSTLVSAKSHKDPGIRLYDSFYQTWNFNQDIQNQQATLSGFKWRPLDDKNLINPQDNRQGLFFGEYVVSRISGGGGVGGQSGGKNPIGNKLVIPAGSEWFYYAKGEAPPKADDTIDWRDGDLGGIYNQYAKWPTGLAPLGYSPNGVDGERWLIPSCPSELNCYVVGINGASFQPGCLTSPCTSRWITSYFRKVVDSGSWMSSLYKSIIINYKRDDGIIIYVNGKELPRESNMGPDPVTNTTTATEAARESEWNTLIIANDGSFFRPFYTSTIAVELHQNSNTSSDAHFDMEIILSPHTPPNSNRLAALEAATPTEPLTILYPNPTENGKVHFTEAMPYEAFRITDTRGVVVRYIAEPGILTEVDMGGLSAGAYILTSQNKNKTSHFKIIKK